MWLSKNKSEHMSPSLFPPTLHENKIAWLYLERADVTSALSREFINCESLTNHRTAQQTDEDETLHPGREGCWCQSPALFQEVIRNTMYHLRVPVFLLAALVLLRCITAAPSVRYFSPGSSSDEQENAHPDKVSRSLPELTPEPIIDVNVVRLQRGLTATNSHQFRKRQCNSSTCVTQRLADKLSQPDTGSTTVDKNSFGKRDIPQSPAQLP
ncbi:uncharacterized protein LOC122826697 [Gambusia affinis]|uniref:uncharacterized protein LOC122826697 n=1 Tax=Gambusia affinis TaxID=33528 RepID=UPI001CDC8F42|nr:uncharacterized protein LOC122826697 [Gambusia affinis]